MKVSIICTCDESYLPLLNVFIKSLYTNSKTDCNFYIRLINVDKTPEFLKGKKFNIIHDNTVLCNKRNKLIDEGLFLHDIVHGDNVRRNTKSIYKGARWLYSDKMAYCANIKYTTINEVLDLEENLFYFDVDAVVRKDLSGLFNQLSTHELLIKTTPSNPDKPFSEPYTHLYHTGIIGIKNTTKVKEFFSLLENRCRESDFFNWDTDQVEFANLIERDMFKINLGDIDDTYKDEFYRDESHLWCGAAAGKNSNPKYIQEMMLYDI